jgi:hypothetical protein
MVAAAEVLGMLLFLCPQIAYGRGDIIRCVGILEDLDVPIVLSLNRIEPNWANSRRR